MTGSARKTYKKQLIALRGAKCEICGITEWQGESIVFDDHHIDRNRKNGHESNRKILCPNCHRQQHKRRASPSVESRRKHSVTNSDGRFKGKNNGMYGKHLSIESRAKQSATLSDGRMKGENNSMYGTHHSVESKQKLSKRMSGKNHPLFGTHCSDITKAKQRATLFATLSKKKENAL